MARSKKYPKRGAERTSWDPLARWYDGWVGEGGSKYHRRLAVPAVMALLELRMHERVLDLGAGQGVLCPPITELGASYTGVDMSEQLLQFGREHHGEKGVFIRGDATNVMAIPGIQRGAYDAAVFLLSLQDMDPLEDALEGAAWALKEGGRLVILMTHPCFRVPRQSGWGFDENRKLKFRRVDRYLTPLPVPLKPYPGRSKGVSVSFHRPLHEYVNGLSEVGLLIDQMREIPTFQEASKGKQISKADRMADQEFPLFLAIRAVKI